MRTDWPFQKISPECGSSEPNSILTRVDLPAPFSPSKRVNLALGDRQIDRVARFQRAEDLGEPANLEQVRGFATV